MNDTTELQPLSREITDEIRFILEGIQDGKLKHIQSDFHCGTAHCVAGWKTLFTFLQDSNLNINQENCDLDTNEVKFSEWFNNKANSLSTGQPICLHEGTATTFTNWVIAQKAWELTNIEADLLFEADATLEEQFDVLETLESGLRITR